MKVDSLEELKEAFDAWRRGKRHIREPVPSDLLHRAQRAIRVHGIRGVVRATSLERSNLERRPQKKAAKSKERGSPAFSRLELVPPSSAAVPVAELETADGTKLRLFEMTPEMMGLLGQLCGVGGT